MTNVKPNIPNAGWSLAISRVGSQQGLSLRLGLSPSEVTRYARNLRQTPPRLAMRLDVELGVPRHLTRPDLFPGPDRGCGEV